MSSPSTTRFINGLNPFKIIAPKPIISELPRLLYGLEAVLERKGPVFLMNPGSSGNFNFDPYLANIPQLETLRLQNLKPFLRAANDKSLHQLGRDNDCLFNTSTSSITGLLAQIYHMILNKSKLETSSFSPDLSDTVSSHSSPFLRSGCKVQLVFNDGVYTVDQISASNEITDLMTYGHVLELFLTSTPDEFTRIFQGNKQLDSPEHYSYGKFGDMVIRSQLDAQDPVKSMAFDLKTRAVLPIRKSIHDYKNHRWYEINKLSGVYESFEREYYDMLRSAFLKYSMQARLGNMQGIFVAYHNTRKMFGFEFVSLKEMEEGLFGNQEFAEIMFSLSMKIANTLLSRVVEAFPHQDSVIFVARPRSNQMAVFVEPINPKTGQIPLYYQISISATLNGLPIQPKMISYKSGDKVELGFDLLELEYDPGSHQRKEKEYQKLFSFSSSFGGGRFINNLKAQLDMHEDRKKGANIKGHFDQHLWKTKPTRKN